MIKNIMKLADLFLKLAEKVYNCRWCGAPHRSVDPEGFICGQCGTANRPQRDVPKDTFKELFEDKQDVKEPIKEKEEKFKAEKCPLCEHSHDDCLDLNCNCDYQECSECGYDHSYEPEEAAKVHKLLKFTEYKDEDEFPYEKFAAGVARSKKERGISCVKADHPHNSSHLDKFPVNKLSEAKAALKRMSITTKAPKWWKGSLDELKNLVMKVVSDNYKVENKEGKITVTNKN